LRKRDLLGCRLVNGIWKPISTQVCRRRYVSLNSRGMDALMHRPEDFFSTFQYADAEELPWSSCVLDSHFMKTKRWIFIPVEHELRPSDEDDTLTGYSSSDAQFAQVGTQISFGITTRFSCYSGSRWDYSDFFVPAKGVDGAAYGRHRSHHGVVAQD